MNHKPAVLDVLIGAMEKLNPHCGERQNVQAFVESCYGGRVRSFDFEAAVTSLRKLTDQEQRTLIIWTLLETDGRDGPWLARN